MKQLSIIIPLYNVEPFIERCIRSLENQNLPKAEFEIICINDGSPDNSREVVIKLQQEFENIELIDQDNQGVSRARNKGIDKAIGKYLLFIDPDDYVDQDCFERVLEIADTYDAQVTLLGYTFLNNDGSVRNRIYNELHASKIFSGPEAYFLSRGDGRTDPDRMWAILFQSNFINSKNLRFLPDVPYLEDGEFIARILSLAERCIFDGNSFYQRTTRLGSATNSKLYLSEKARNGFLLAARNLKIFQQEQQLNTVGRLFLNQPICKFILLSLMSTMNNLTEFRRMKKKLSSMNMRKCVLKGCNNYYLIEGFLYNLSPYLFFLHRKIGTPLIRLVKP